MVAAQALWVSCPLNIRKSSAKPSESKFRKGILETVSLKCTRDRNLALSSSPREGSSHKRRTVRAPSCVDEAVEGIFFAPKIPKLHSPRLNSSTVQQIESPTELQYSQSHFPPMKGVSNNLPLLKKGLTISFEGNIGVGKSTLLRLVSQELQKLMSVEVLQEPLQQWQDVNGTGLNMLNAFYDDPKRYGYLFQNFVFLTRFVQHHSGAVNNPYGLRLSERSVFTDRCVFAASAIESGTFTPLETAAYNAWYDPVLSSLPNLVPDSFVYLQASPEVCFNRLKRRGRSEELGVPLEYLESLHKKHEAWFIQGAYGAEAATSHPNGGGVEGALLERPSVRLDGGLTHAALDGCPVLVVDATEHMILDNETSAAPMVTKICDYLRNLVASQSDSAVIV